MSPPPGNWQSRFKKVAATALLVAVGLYIAARLILAVAPVLIVTGLIGVGAYAGVLIARHRRSKW
jgi:hypothetical protein